MDQRVHVCVFVHFCVNTANGDESSCRNSKLHQSEVEFCPQQLHKRTRPAVSSPQGVSGIDVGIWSPRQIVDRMCEKMGTVTE